MVRCHSLPLLFNDIQIWGERHVGSVKTSTVGGPSDLPKKKLPPPLTTPRYCLPSTGEECPKPAHVTTPVTNLPRRSCRI
jgi:hypothetical protein